MPVQNGAGILDVSSILDEYFGYFVCVDFGLSKCYVILGRDAEQQ